MYRKYFYTNFYFCVIQFTEQDFTPEHVVVPPLNTDFYHNVCTQHPTSYITYYSNFCCQCSSNFIGNKYLHGMIFPQNM